MKYFSAEKMCLSVETIISSAEKVSLGILETQFSQKCYPPSWFYPCVLLEILIFHFTKSLCHLKIICRHVFIKLTKITKKQLNWIQIVSNESRFNYENVGTSSKPDSQYFKESAPPQVRVSWSEHILFLKVS